jgi:asparagine synthase (glutamine-hydrolysing)
VSALAGIFKFDPRDPVLHTEMQELARGIDRSGPDGGTEYIVKNIGMAFRAFVTTPEAHYERQPLVSSNCILTWDGRLDNRKEIIGRLPKQDDGLASDLEIVRRAYAEWGTACIRELVGDFALAVWDIVEQKLVLARDCFGVRPLFYRLDETGITWCSVIEPLATEPRRALTIDDEYLASCICPYPQLGSTPYREIRAVVPSHFLEVCLGGRQETKRYWSLNPCDRIRYRVDAEYEEHFRALFRNSVRQRLRADRPVISELSGGVDSSSIVCMADAIHKEEDCPELSTLSYYDSDEPSGDERPFISFIERMRGRTSTYISVSEFNKSSQSDATEPVFSEQCWARPGTFRQFLYWDEIIQGIQDKLHARVVLSGLGGDEFLGGVQYEALELLEHLLAGKFKSFARAMLAWSLARKKPVFMLLNDVWRLARAAQTLDSFSKPALVPEWLLRRPARQDSVLNGFSTWSSLSPAHLCAETARYSMASMLSCSQPPLVGMCEKRYPYLDRTLFTFLASIPREQIIRPRERRSLMRRSLRGLVPDEVLFRKSKWFGTRGTITFLSDRGGFLDRLFGEPWKTGGVLFDMPLIREHLTALQHGANSEGMQLRSAIGIEVWMRHQLSRGAIANYPSAVVRS